MGRVTGNLDGRIDAVFLNAGFGSRTRHRGRDRGVRRQGMVEMILPMVTLGGLGTAAEVAAAATFLLSDKPATSPARRSWSTAA